MSETQYTSRRNCRFDDCLYADDGFIAELPVSYSTENIRNSYYCTENIRNSYYCTENHGICHFSKTRKITELADFQHGIGLCQTWSFGGSKFVLKCLLESLKYIFPFLSKIIALHQNESSCENTRTVTYSNWGGGSFFNINNTVNRLGKYYYWYRFYCR